MGMKEYFLRHIVSMVVTLLGVSIITFVLVRSIPGDPIVIMLGQSPASEEEYTRLRLILGLDQPIYMQYFLYLKRALSGDLGTSMTGSGPVLSLVLERFFGTLTLTSVAILFSSVIGIGLGVVTTITRRKGIDNMIRLVSIGGFSVPSFWVGLTLVYVFSVRLRWLPSFGGGGIPYLILPSIAISVWVTGFIARLTRASVLDVMSQDFMLTAQAKGLSRMRIVLDYLLRNALIPIMTTIGLWFGRLLGGTIIVETVFSYPGIGLLTVEHLFKRDYPVIQGSMLFTATSICLTSFLVDILYALVDPRIRHGENR